MPPPRASHSTTTAKKTSVKPADAYEPAPADPAVRARAEQLAARAPVPARVGRVLTGTAGWTDPTLIKSGRFYPTGSTSPEERLRYYASQFPMVEVDSGYYALPSRINAERWVERTPEGFAFGVKAFAAMTGHPVEWARLPKDLQSGIPDKLREKKRVYPKDLPPEVLSEVWTRFAAALEPLQAAGKLGYVLLQYPPWFAATRGNSRAVEAGRAALAGMPVAVEFRNPSWGDPARLPRVLELLRGIEASYVSVDEPQGTARSMPDVAAVAHPGLAVVRFHGRRAESWARPASVTEKFDYLYDPAELSPWVPRVQELSQQAEQVHLVFNNCVSDHAVLGARDIAALLATA